MLDLFILGSSAAVPSPSRSLPCIVVRWKGEPILFDVGECCQRQMMINKVHYGSIRKVFISHLHVDHFLGLFGLVETLSFTSAFKAWQLDGADKDELIEEKGKKAGKEAESNNKEYLDVYAPRRFSSIFFNRKAFTRIHELSPSTYDFGEYTIEAFPVKHWGESYGFVFQEKPKRRFEKEKAKHAGLKDKMFKMLLERGELSINRKHIRLDDVSHIEQGVKLMYTGDTLYFDGLVEKAKHATLIIADATFDEALKDEAHKRGHMTAKEAAQLAEKARAKTLVLTHISNRYSGEAAAILKEQAEDVFSGEVVIASDGLHINVK